ncbi:transposase (plasmid) [Synechocystis sp. PCC 6803]|uniref:Transposase n=1 Tax=Synechocystis sp. (strain ATCC 27184 / PCC 6803 / Kazusa) TaxID=1111708 RepID=Q6ZE51_SYNY3|nr:transposase [Synechocystis sp. PCC 6803]MBD2619712.1 hypothetical protein [Synechocystis sp. FACHB-898]BAD02049.1 transposase [Synechocystis sp. PCC 6803]
MKLSVLTVAFSVSALFETTIIVVDQARQPLIDGYGALEFVFGGFAVADVTHYCGCNAVRRFIHKQRF